MEFFSWKTQDTDRSISNKHCENKKTFTVFMLDNKGNKWKETDYDGYGVFGGKDYYELLAEMNEIKGGRENGIKLVASNKKYKTPNLVENKELVWVDEEPENCQHLGYFYDSYDLGSDMGDMILYNMDPDEMEDFLDL